MSWQCAGPDRECEAWGHARRRFADGVSYYFYRRELRSSDFDVSAQPDGNGYRGDDPRAADGFSSGDWRMRQDSAGPGDGRRECRSADYRGADGADGGWPSQR